MANAQNPFIDFDVSKLLNPTRLFGEFKLNGFDVEAVLAGQRRNFEAFTAANQAAIEGFQAVAERQAEILRQSVDEASRAVKELLAAGSPEEKAARQADLAKAAYERAVAHTRELAEIVARSQNEAFNVLNKRVTEGLDEVKTLIAKQAGKEQRAAA